MLPTALKTATIDIDRASEFTGDDVDQFSSLVDLGKLCEHVQVVLPALTSSTVSIYVQDNDAIATVPKVVHILDDDATGSFLHASTAGTGDIIVNYRPGPVQYLRVRCTSNQAADRAILVRGF